MSDVPGEWKSLHQASMLVNLLPRAWRVARSAWPLLLAALYGGATDRVGLVDLSLLFVFFALTVGSTVVHWLTLRYRVHEGRLEIESGLVQRQLRTIDPKRVQNVEMVRNLFHRMSGLVELRIETASGKEVEGLLSALTVAEAKALIDALQSARQITVSEAPKEGAVVVENGLMDLVRHGATATRLGAAVVVVGIVLEFLPAQNAQEVEGWFRGVGFAVIIPALLVVAWLLGIAASIMRHYGFRLRQEARGLVAEEGLFTRRTVELRTDKVQLVTVSEPLLRRWLGFGSIHIETAAASGEGGTRISEATVPVLGREEVAAVVRQILPIGLDIDRVALRPPNPRALRRAFIASLIRSSLLGTLGSLFLWPWGLFLWLAVPLGLGLAWLDFRTQGWLVTNDAIVTRSGFLHRRTQMLLRKKLQSLELIQGPLLQYHDLGLVAIRVAGSGIVVPPIAWEESKEMLESLTAMHPWPQAFR